MVRRWWGVIVVRRRAMSIVRKANVRIIHIQVRTFCVIVPTRQVIVNHAFRDWNVIETE